jgi:hypothetical protein
MNPRMYLVACFVAALSSATACKSVAKRLTKEVAKEVNQAASPGSDAEQATMGRYATGFNVLIGDPKKVIDEYFDDVPVEGPKPDEKYRLFPAHTRASIELEKARQSFDEAAKSAPDDLKYIAPLATTAVADIKKTIGVFEEAHKYYQAEDFKDDEGKKGKELHQQMVAASKAAEKSLDKLSDALSEVEEREAKKELARFEADKGYSYWFRRFNFEANKALKVTKSEGFKKAFSGIDAQYTAVKGFADGKGDALNATFKAYVGQVERFHSTAKKLSRAYAEAEPKASEIGQLRSQLVSAYNGLVSTGNSMRELEANDLLK